MDRDAAAVHERAQSVAIRALDLDVDFAAGEEMRTEISAKFRRAGVERELAAAGLRARRSGGPIPPGDFALSLSFALTASGARILAPWPTRDA